VGEHVRGWQFIVGTGRAVCRRFSRFDRFGEPDRFN
jgi:hypothetical protein